MREELQKVRSLLGELHRPIGDMVAYRTDWEAMSNAHAEALEVIGSGFTILDKLLAEPQTMSEEAVAIRLWVAKDIFGRRPAIGWDVQPDEVKEQCRREAQAALAHIEANYHLVKKEK